MLSGRKFIEKVYWLHSYFYFVFAFDIVNLFTIVEYSFTLFFHSRYLTILVSMLSVTNIEQISGLDYRSINLTTISFIKYSTSCFDLFFNRTFSSFLFAYYLFVSLYDLWFFSCLYDSFSLLNVYIQHKALFNSS
jgi:hypothetical protein